MASFKKTKIISNEAYEILRYFTITLFNVKTMYEKLGYRNMNLLF